MFRTGMGIIIKLTLAFFAIITGNSFESNGGDTSLQNWISENAIEIRGLEINEASDDLHQLEYIVANAKLVCLGESRHDAREQFQVKHRLIKYLVEEMGFTSFMLEGSLPYCSLINDYINGDGGDIDLIMAGMPGWFLWDTEEMKEIIEWMYVYNSGAGNYDKIQFFGIDIVAPNFALEQIFNFLEEHDIDVLQLFEENAFERDLIFDDSWPRSRESYASLPSSRKEELVTNYDELYEVLEQKREQYISSSSEKEYNWILRMAYCAKEANRLFSSKTNLELGLVRESAMAENALWIQRNLSNSGKSIIWAHNVHIAMDEFTMSIQEGTIQGMGYLIKQELKEDMVSIGASFDKGDYPEWGKSFPAADPSTLDGVLAAAGMEYFLIDLKKSLDDNEVHKWLNSSQVMRAQDFDMSCIPIKSFDAMYFTSSISHTIPNEHSSERFRNMN